ncbi:hypothetical protein D3C80_1365740 [compost metagenome]
MAVQAQACLKAQGVAGTQADGLDFRFGQQRTGQGFGAVGRYGDFKTVFTGVTGAADKALHAQQVDAGELHEGHLRNVRRQTCQHGDGGRALQGQQGTFFEQRLNAALFANVLAQVRQVLILAGGVDHQEQFVVTQVGDHQVVEDAAVFIGEHRVALHAHWQVDDVDRHQGFQGLGRIGTAQADLAHVRDVEQAGLIAAVQMLFHHPQRVLDRHVVAGERHHARTQFQVQGVQRGLEQCFGGH